MKPEDIERRGSLRDKHAMHRDLLVALFLKKKRKKKKREKITKFTQFLVSREMRLARFLIESGATIGSVRTVVFHSLIEVVPDDESHPLVS